jgi:hypothetical protein
MLKWTALAAAALYARELRRLEPTPKDLLNPEWHRGAPLRLLLGRMADALPAIQAKYGGYGVRALQFVFYQIGADRANLMRKALDIDVNDARSLGRVIDYQDGLLGVSGVWTEESRGRAVKEEHQCPAAGELARCPQVCEGLISALEAGTFSVLNPGLKAPFRARFLSRGDDRCIVVLEQGGISGRSGSYPYFTLGEKTPDIRAPGLWWKLAVTALASVAVALVKIAVSGADQPMMWYESFRLVD